MKFTAALYLLAFSSSAITAPISGTLDKVPSRTGSSNSGVQQDPRIRLPVKASNRQPNENSGGKGPKAEKLQFSNSQRLPSSDQVASKLPKENPAQKPKSSYIASLAHRLTSKQPFPESSIVREETRASTGDWEPEATIVEWETKASREAYFWLPCLSADKSLRYHRVRVNTDMLVVSLVLSLIAIILVIELWKPVTARFRRFRSGHGPIYLDGDEVAAEETTAQKLCIPICGPMLEVKVESRQEPGKAEITTTTSTSTSTR
ncbi:hypothetical protein ONZ43_g2116 [Nemania bipapillata]|uniref:Uncharacterized protein n=1 Tax=Nemania bipapillata TaxID=110536 RepID=A0ACC2J1S8_9PEZI|nr:hypothetical protein ONZ43_g2116 [Nemania bipapillata]